MPDTPAASLRVRPWRVATLAMSLGLTLSAAAGTALGLGSTQIAAEAAPVRSAGSADPGSSWLVALTTGATAGLPTGELANDGRFPSRPTPGDAGAVAPGPTSDSDQVAHPAERALDPPARSGTGRRVVFDESAQRVWLMRDNGSTRRTYLVSGSRMDNLDQGRYEVYSRSRHAVAFDYSATMDHMVRFSQGEHAAIGFHDIPTTADGRPVQRWSDLGTPTSAGCIRQRARDARAMWAFARLGTPVHVVA